METKRMPRIKSSEQRLRIIDKLLAGNRKIKDREMLRDLVNDEIYPDSIGLEMLDKDLKQLRELADTDDVSIRWTKTHGYKYSQPNYRYYQKALTDEDKVMLVLAQNLFQTFRQTSLKEKFRDLVEKVVENDGSARFWETNKARKFIQPEFESESPGNKWLPELIIAIHEQQQVQVNYAGEKKELSPYVLKQNRGLWYLVAYDHSKKGEEAIKIYSLNRIQQILPGSSSYFQDPSFKPDEYFKYSLGIWHKHGTKPTRVRLSFHHPRIMENLQQQKLHPTQKIIETTTRSLKIEIEVYDSIELENLILGYGEHVRVLAPQELRRRVHERAALIC